MWCGIIGLTLKQVGPFSAMLPGRECTRMPAQFLMILNFELGGNELCQAFLTRYCPVAPLE